jgi:hypothetical protein
MAMITQSQRGGEIVRERFELSKMG